jgi:predicted dienelactone hydrolase
MTNVSMKRGLLICTVLLFIVQGVAAADVTRSPFTDFLLKPGLFGVGVTTVPLVDTTRGTPATLTCAALPTRTLTTEVWYPTQDPSLMEARDALPAKSLIGFPLIVHAHGITSDRLEFSYVAAHLASHGYVVAAPDFPLTNGASIATCQPSAAVISADVASQAGDVIFVSQALVSPLIKAIAPTLPKIDSNRTGLSGYSLGGTTAILASYYSPTIKAVALSAPETCALFGAGILPAAALTKPSIILQGTTDIVVHLDNNAQPLFEANAEPKYLVSIENGSHGGFIAKAPLIEAAYPGYAIDTIICNLLKAYWGGPCDTCVPPYLLSPQMLSSRQHDLTKAGHLAFFNGYLRSSLLDRVFLKYIMDYENADVDVTYADH